MIPDFVVQFALAPLVLPLLEMGFKGLGNILGAKAKNKQAKLEAAERADALRLARASSFREQQAEDRDERGDAWKRLLQAGFVREWQPSGQRFSPYTRDIVGPTASAREGAKGLEEEVRLRLLQGSQLPDVPRLETALDLPQNANRFQGSFSKLMERIRRDEERRRNPLWASQ